jgi:hypothetical protein
MRWKTWRTLKDLGLVDGSTNDSALTDLGRAAKQELLWRPSQEKLAYYAELGRERGWRTA